MATLQTFVLFLILGCVLADSPHEHNEDHYKEQLLRHHGRHAMEGEKHIDTHATDQGTDHDGKVLDHKGKDKSLSNTQAVLTATMNAKDAHQDSYSHLHDNAHETEAMDDTDHIRGDETVIGAEQGLFGEEGHQGPHGDLNEYGEPYHIHPTEHEWDEVDHGHYEDLLNDGDHGHDGYENFGHGGRLDGDMYTGPDYDMHGGNHHMIHGGEVGHHGSRLGGHDEVPWVAGDHHF